MKLKDGSLTMLRVVSESAFTQGLHHLKDTEHNIVRSLKGKDLWNVLLRSFSPVPNQKCATDCHHNACKCQDGHGQAALGVPEVLEISIRIVILRVLEVLEILIRIV